MNVLYVVSWMWRCNETPSLFSDAGQIRHLRVDVLRLPPSQHELLELVCSTELGVALHCDFSTINTATTILLPLLLYVPLMR